ncbi:hypothetical protein [Nitrincola alkalisediminis]|uniref:hypothetical protein n=1 Tax=Nitrincola alkalisediminis TaxID=1366656 RepID=UPI001873E743|nr:hypothetical protein [Nitrincola alkalisediminis]
MLPDYLAVPTKAENQTVIHSMLFAQWNTAYDIVTEHNPDEVVSISSCNEYLSRQYDGLSTVLEYEYAYFRMIATMCHAGDLIVRAQPPTATSLSYPLDGKMLPQQLPAEVAFVASESYRADLLRNPKVQTWADVLEVLDNQIVEFSSESPNQFHFETDDGEITQISLIARGDFTGDGLDEILILAESYFRMAVGGYSMDTLYVLSPDTTENRFHFVQEVYLNKKSNLM